MSAAVLRRAAAALVLAVVGCEASGPPRSTSAPPAAAAPEALSFALQDGGIDNRFYQAGAISAHVLAAGGARPRILAAFPAGNAGIGVWFAAEGDAALSIAGALQPVDAGGGLRGVRAELRAAAPRLRTSGIVLSSVRVLRDFVGDPGSLPPEVQPSVEAGPPVVVRRRTVDGAHRLELRVEPGPQTEVALTPDGGLLLSGGSGGVVAVFTFLQDDAALTPLQPAELWTADVGPGERDRRALRFLSYREKLLAGSWRFLTYFGRDTLLTLRLLLPVLAPEAIEGGLGAVLERLNAGGEVAHEEDIGEQAALRHLRQEGAAGSAPLMDYKMIDDDFLLAPVAAHYLLDTAAGPPRAAAFLGRRTADGASFAEALGRNLDFVEARAQPFARSGASADLVGLLPGQSVGNWRDSDDGLGGGRFPYDVNAVLVPAALRAAARLHAAGLLGATAARREAEGRRAAEAAALAERWTTAAGLFTVTVPASVAHKRMAAYAAEVGLSDALPPLPGAALELPALALDAGGRPIPVLHSDEGFALLFSEPDPAALEAMVERLLRPFPLGLLTPVGLVIANPALLQDPGQRRRFGPDRYHGAVVWSWQQAMLAAGLARQLGRGDLGATTRGALQRASDALWRVIDATAEVRTAEHWSWRRRDGRWEVRRFGEGTDVEANAAQLWSTVYLAVRPPR